jgi:Rrf2 family protein
MRLSTKGEYGLLALVDVAMHTDEGVVQVHQIAERQGIPKQYLDQLMAMLKKAGFVTSSRGRQGGYSLARRPDTVTLLDVITALEGPVHNPNFLPRGRRKLPARGVLRNVWDDLWARSIGTLRGKTLEDICHECELVERAPMYYI